MTFRTGITIQAIGDLTPSNVVDLGMAIKLRHIEFDPSVFPDISNVLKRLATEQTTIHAPYMEDYHMDLSSQTQKIDQLIENINHWKSQMNIIGVVVHPPLDAGGSTDKFYDRLEKLPLPLIENMPYQSWEDFLDFFNTTQANVNNSLGICFDIPHSFITNGEKFLEVPEEVLDHLTSPQGYIHLSGGTAEEDTHYPLLTEGDMPFHEVKEFLGRIAFRGTITMELYPRSFQDIDKILQSYIMMLGVANKRKHKLFVQIKRPFIMRRINKLAKTNKIPPKPKKQK
ncbi:MAG: TIM barrel protein [Candidatus Hodarchaeales archaeon]|jgi:sugar phosphate isomerase/epimerase